MMFRLVRRTMVWALCCMAMYVAMAAFPQASFAQSATALGPSELIQPEELVRVLESHKAKPLILNVGPSMIYMQAHIRGAEYIGPGSEAEGLQKLRMRVRSLPHNAFIVLYCGCCPWTRCPNIYPAYMELHRMGFRNVKALYLADNFGADWVNKGYPTDLGNQ